MNIQIKEVINKVANDYEGNDKEFFLRVWNTDMDIYANRLKAIGFTGKEKVLDAGFGTGQWLIALSELNKEVHGVEYSQVRVDATQKIVNALNISNTKLSCQSIEKMDYEDNSFDAIFCFGVIFITDFKKSLTEFKRLLKPGGKLYVSANGVGWYYFLIMEEHNKSEAYDPRKMSFDVFDHTLNYYSKGIAVPGMQIVIPQEVMKGELEKLGFEDIVVDKDGGINLTGVDNIVQFFKGDYQGYECVYEIVASKK